MICVRTRLSLFVPGSLWLSLLGLSVPAAVQSQQGQLPTIIAVDSQIMGLRGGDLPQQLRTQIDAVAARVTAGEMEVAAAALEDVRRRARPLLEDGRAPEAQHNEVKALRITLVSVEEEMGLRRGEYAKVIESATAHLKFMATVTDPMARHYEVRSVVCLVMALESTQRPQECLPWLKHVVTMLKTKEVTHTKTLMEDLSSLALRARALGLPEEADYLVEKAVKLVEEAAAKDTRSQLFSLSRIATVFIEQGKLLEAEAVLLKALKIADAEKSPTGMHMELFLGLGKVQENIFTLQGGKDRLDKAEKLYQEAFEKAEKVDGKLPPATAAVRLSTLAALEQLRGRPAEAVEMRKQAFDISEKNLGPKHDTTLVALGAYISVLEIMGRLPDALKLQQDLLERSEAARGGLHPDVATAQHSLGSLRMRLGHFTEAEKCFERAAGIRERTLGANHGETAKSYFNLGVLRETKGDFAGAAAYFEHVLKIDRIAHGEGSAVVVEDTISLAGALIKEGRFDDAQARLNESLKMVEKMLGKDHPVMSAGLLALATVQERLERFDEAEKLYQRVIAIRTKSMGAEHGLVAEGRARHAIFLVTRNKLTLAAAEMRRAAVSYSRQRKREGTGAGDLQNCLDIYQHILRKLQYDERTIQKHVRSLEGGIDPVDDKSQTDV
ncbi:MAG: tetratricopeptide repeat protein [Prosthecobacter sp.]